MNRFALVVGVTTLVCSVPLSANPIEHAQDVQKIHGLVPIHITV